MTAIELSSTQPESRFVREIADRVYAYTHKSRRLVCQQRRCAGRAGRRGRHRHPGDRESAPAPLVEFVDGLDIGPARTIVNTHHHGDHNFGNHLFGPTSVRHRGTTGSGRR